MTEATIEIRVLGPFELLIDGVSVDVRSREATLLSWLVLHRTQGADVKRTIGALWPRLDSHAGEAQLRQSASLLRRVLQAADVGVTRSAGCISLRDNRGRCAIDADQFEMLLGQAERLIDEGRHDSALGSLERACRLWRDDLPYVKASATPAGMDEIRRLLELRSRAEDLYGELMFEYVWPVNMIGALLQRTRRQPHHELAWRQLMVAYSRSGRNADALRTYQRYRQLLLDRNDEPSADSRTLERLVLDGEPIPRGLYAAPRLERLPHDRAATPRPTTLELLLRDWLWTRSQGILAVIPTTHAVPSDLAGAWGVVRVTVDAGDEAAVRALHASLVRAAPFGAAVVGSDTDPVRLAHAIARHAPVAIVVQHADRSGPALINVIYNLVTHASAPIAAILSTDVPTASILRELILRADLIVASEDDSEPVGRHDG